MLGVNTSSAQGYSYGSGASSGAPINFAGAGIYFGTADIGATDQTNTPSVIPSLNTSPVAALGSGASGTPALAGNTSTSSLSPILIIGALAVAGYLAYKFLT